MAGRRRQNNRRNQVEHQLNDGLDELSEYEKFKAELLPAIRKDLASGMDAKELLKKYQAYAASSLLTTALMGTSASDRTAAAKYIIDQGSGKATENKKIEHRLQEIPENQLDSLIFSELEEVESD